MVASVASAKMVPPRVQGVWFSGAVGRSSWLGGWVWHTYVSSNSTHGQQAIALPLSLLMLHVRSAAAIELAPLFSHKRRVVNRTRWAGGTWRAQLEARIRPRQLQFSCEILQSSPIPIKITAVVHRLWPLCGSYVPLEGVMAFQRGQAQRAGGNVSGQSFATTSQPIELDALHMCAQHFLSLDLSTLNCLAPCLAYRMASTHGMLTQDVPALLSTLSECPRTLSLRISLFHLSQSDRC